MSQPGEKVRLGGGRASTWIATSISSASSSRVRNSSPRAASLGCRPTRRSIAFGSDSNTYELAGFGELAYHFTDKLTLTGGLRYGKYGGTLDTDAGYNSAYFAYALGGVPWRRCRSCRSPRPRHDFKSAERTSWKASFAYEPSRDLMTYVTVSTGYRTPVYNARAGSVSIVNPNDLVIPAGAGSDDLTNYEIGLKGRWLGGKLTTNLAAYYIDWENIQVQANRPSDSVQFSTNVGRAASQGLEAEITLTPVRGLTFGLNAAFNEAEVKELTAQEAVISGAEKGSRLASPRVQGSFFGTYNYKFGGTVTGFSSFQIAHVGSFPNGFPNTPGRAGCATRCTARPTITPISICRRASASTR